MGYFCFSPGEIFIALLCLSLLFFFLTFIWWLHGIDFYPPVCCLCEQCASWGEGERERWKALFFLQGGFHTPPSKEAFRAHPLRFFGQEQREYVGTNASSSVWLVWLEDAVETGSLQPTESIPQQKNFTVLNDNTPWEAWPLTQEKNSSVRELSWEI